jgi:hypothetical protein
MTMCDGLSCSFVLKVVEAAFEEPIVVPLVPVQGAPRQTLGESIESPRLCFFLQSSERIDLAVMGKVIRRSAGKVSPPNAGADLSSELIDENVRSGSRTNIFRHRLESAVSQPFVEHGLEDGRDGLAVGGEWHTSQSGATLD